MKHDEVILFKCYDKQLGGPRFVMHAAFDHPETPENAPSRTSIEVRSIACFDEECANPLD